MVAMARTRAASQVCQAASAAAVESSSTLQSTDSGGVPRPLTPMHGTGTCTTAMRMSTAKTPIHVTAFLFVAFVMPSD